MPYLIGPILFIVLAVVKALLVRRGCAQVPAVLRYLREARRAVCAAKCLDPHMEDVRSGGHLAETSFKVGLTSWLFFLASDWPLQTAASGLQVGDASMKHCTEPLQQITSWRTNVTACLLFNAQSYLYVLSGTGAATGIQQEGGMRRLAKLNLLVTTNHVSSLGCFAAIGKAVPWLCVSGSRHRARLSSI